MKFPNLDTSLLVPGGTVLPVTRDIEVDCYNNSGHLDTGTTGSVPNGHLASGSVNGTIN